MLFLLEATDPTTGVIQWLTFATAFDRGLTAIRLGSAGFTLRLREY